jgi:CRP-like cAMP-binding protein
LSTPTSIEGVDFLQGLNATARKELMARAVTRRFARGAHLWTAGTEPRGLFVLLSGRVRIVRTTGHRQHVLHIEGPGATLGEVPLFSGGTYPASAIADEPSSCLVIDRGTLVVAMHADPQLGWILLERLARRVRHLVERLSAQTADPVRERLAAHLRGRPVGPDGAITLGGTQQQVADEIGTVREVVVRLLRQWSREGLLRRVQRGSYVLAGPDGLDVSPAGGPPAGRRPSPDAPGRSRPAPRRAAAPPRSRRS